MIVEEKSRLSTYRCTFCGAERPFGVGHTEMLVSLACRICDRPTKHQFVAINEYLIECEVAHENAKGLLFTYKRISHTHEAASEPKG